MRTQILRQRLWLSGFMGILGVLGLLASVQAQPTGLTDCGSISASGTYRLENNVTATGNCLSVEADFITINLNGFTLTGDGSSSGIICSGFQGLDIRNGTVTSFATGVRINQCPNSRVNGVQAIANNVGIRVGDNSDVSGSLALNNTAQGVIVSGTSTAVGSTIANNNDVGISAANCPNLLLGNVANNNTTTYHSRKWSTKFAEELASCS